jgi:MFS transporter, putative metabolite:H+ symporter
VANLADLLGFFDLFLIGYVTAALIKEWSLTYLQGGTILMASGIGAPPGAGSLLNSSSEPVGSGRT